MLHVFAISLPYVGEMEALHLGILAASAVVGLAAAWWLSRMLQRIEDARAEAEVEVRKGDTQAPRGPKQRLSWWLRITPWSLPVLAVAVALDLTGLFPMREGAKVVRDGLATPLITLGEQPVTPMRILLVGLVLYLGTWVSTFAQVGVARAMRRQSADDGVIASLQRLTHYAMLGASFVFALNVAGFDLATLLTSLAVLGVGVGLGLQEVVRNFVSGIILLVEQSIKPGDMITVDGRVVTVQSLGIRACVARTMDDDDIVVPNSILVENAITNHSLRSNAVRARVMVGVSYGSDLDQVFDVLRQAADACPDRDLQAQHEPVVLLRDFGASSVDFEVSVWASSAFTRPRVLSDLRKAVWDAFKGADIEISFPQLDLHLDEDVVDVLRGPNRPAEGPSGDQTSSSSSA